MEKKVLERRASDNEYFHRDFHLSMNMLLDYILLRFGMEGVKEYLREYTLAYHRPLTDKLKEGKLDELKKYVEDLYEKEKWSVKIEYSSDHLTFSIDSCPGVTYIYDNNQIPSKAYIETYRTVYETMCQDTPYDYEMVSFDKANGKSSHQFTRRETK